MNLLRGIGAALTSYGTERSARKREESATAAQEARLRQIGQGMAGVATGVIEPGTPEFVTYAADALAAGVNNPFAAVPEPPKPEEYGAPIAGVGPDGKPGYILTGKRGGVKPVEGWAPPPDAPRGAGAGGGWQDYTDAQGRVWERNAVGGTTRPITLPDGTQLTTRLPGSGAERGTDRAWPGFSEAFDILTEDVYGVRDDAGNFLRSSRPPEEIARKAQLWAEGKWKPGDAEPGGGVAEPTPEARFRGVIDSAMGGAGAPGANPSVPVRIPLRHGAVVPEPDSAAVAQTIAPAPAAPDSAAVSTLISTLDREHPDWTDEQIAEEVRRRIGLRR